jgi:uncharacterized protein
MLVLLPPSEGKASPPRRGHPVYLTSLSFPELASTRQQVLDALTTLCGDEVKAREVLALSPGLADEVRRNRDLLATPALPAGRLYTGVLYDALGLDDLSPAAHRRAARSVLITSGLWGVLRIGDRIPPYRLSMAVSLPGIGPLGQVWRTPLAGVLPQAAGHGVVVDLRSATYAAAWRATGELADRTVGVRVLREQAGRRSVVSHMAKHTRGLVARLLLESQRPPTSVENVAEIVSQRWDVELPPLRRGRRTTMDVILRE